RVTYSTFVIIFQMRKRHILMFISGIVALCLCSGIAYNLPPIHDRLAWRVDNLRVEIKRYFNPPEQVVFVPQEQVDAIVDATLTALARTPTQTPPPGLTETPFPSATPSLIPTPIAESAALSGVRHEYQKFNNCAPASLSMVLSYWGWTGDQIETRVYLRPNFEVDDKNVNAFELVDFVKKQTDLDALWRVGGDLPLLKRLLAAGFPVLIEKGLDPHDDAWMGHYQVISGYNDVKGKFLVYDSYEGPPEAYGVPYEAIGQFWRHFNFVYVVIFPAERAAEVQSILGPNSDPQTNFQFAAELALQETSSLSGREQFFAWFNRGTNLVYLQDYAGAAQAYDTAFALYAALPEEERPWRLLWYQDGPYAAYYYSGRYQDVINLAHTTLINVDKPVLEETYYWRGMAKAALGDREGAIEDLNRAFTLNPNSTPAGEELQRLQ
ncbi:MAG TPA: C39 family peptidase, partial [Anaerolineales bacterium]|nr:C39 family peptidase [Anaerolineales bacterium]